MINGSDHSDTVSLAPSWPPASPKRSIPAVYYVQSPSRDSHEEDKSSNQCTTPTTFRSPAESPTTHYHSSSVFGSGARHSRLMNSTNSRPSSASRVSGDDGGRTKAGLNGDDDDRRRWRVVDEEEEGQYYVDERRSCQVSGALMAFVLLFSFFCLVIWGASRPFVPHIDLKSLVVHDFYTGEGSDFVGVPTNMITLNTSLTMSVHNPATFFGIHVSSTAFDLMYYDLLLATGQMQGFYQPRKSWRDVTVEIEAANVPLYGASTGFAAAKTPPGVPMKLVFDLRTRGYVVGKLVKTNHQLRISCSLAMNAYHPRTVVFQEGSCWYD